MGQKIETARTKWKQLKKTSSFHDAVLFLIFVAISALFWFILALNDSAQDNFNVKIQITNVPDTVTFISDIPEKVHVSVRDKGTNLWRSGILRHPSVDIDFKEYSSNGVMRFTHSDLMSALKGTFGSTAQITSSSIDSLRLVYTTNKGKRVPVTVVGAIYPASGSILEGDIRTEPSSVYVYGDKSVVDTIHKVVTDHIEMKDVSETTSVEVELRKIKGARIMPSMVKVTVPIEPLVRKEAMITITAVNVPNGESLLLFPSNVPVDYYVAMSRLSDNDDDDIELQVDYNDIARSSSSRLHVETVRFPDRLRNVNLKSDSVEYTIVKN